LRRVGLGRVGGIDILGNNAGGPLFQSQFTNVRETGWQRVLDLNLGGVFRVCQQVGARMVKRRSGTIVNIATVLPTRAWPAIATYSAAKAGVLRLTQSLAVEWGPAGVRVNALCPGWIRNRDSASLPGGFSARHARHRSCPVAPWGEVEDGVGAAIWLASDAS